MQQYVLKSVIISILTLSLIMLSSCRKKTPAAEGAILAPEKIISNSLDSYQQLILKNKTRQLVLEKKARGWTMIKPDVALADRVQLNELWDAVTAIEGRKLGDDAITKELQGRFDEPDECFVIELVKKAEPPQQWLALPDKEKRRLTYVKNSFNGSIYSIENEYWFDLENWQRKLPARYLLPFNSSRITKIEYRYDDELFILAENKSDDEYDWQMQNPVNKPANDEAVVILMTYLDNLEFYEVKETSVWGKTVLSRYGFHKPIAQLSIWQEKSRLPKILQFGKPADEAGMLYGKYQDETRIVSLPLDTLAKLLVQFEQTQMDKKLITFMHLAKKIDIELPAYERRLVEQQDGWQSYILASDKLKPLQELIAGREEAVMTLGKLNDMVFEDVVPMDTSVYQDFEKAVEIGRITFYTVHDELLSCIIFYQNDEISDYLFVKRDMDGRVLIVNRGIMASLQESK